jgi:hypothetical protein
MIAKAFLEKMGTVIGNHLGHNIPPLYLLVSYCGLLALLGYAKFIGGSYKLTFAWVH